MNVDAAVNISKETWYDSELITLLPASRKVRWRSRSLLWPSRRNRCCAPERACLSDSAPSAVLRSPSRITVPWRSRKGCSEAGEWDSGGGRGDCEKLRKKRALTIGKDFATKARRRKPAARGCVGSGVWDTPRHKPYVLLCVVAHIYTVTTMVALHARGHPLLSEIPRLETIFTRHSLSTSALK